MVAIPAIALIAAQRNSQAVSDMPLFYVRCFPRQVDNLRWLLHQKDFDRHDSSYGANLLRFRSEFSIGQVASSLHPLASLLITNGLNDTFDFGRKSGSRSPETEETFMLKTYLSRSKWLLSLLALLCTFA